VANKLAEGILSGWIQPGHHIVVRLTPDKSGIMFETALQEYNKAA